MASGGGMPRSRQTSSDSKKRSTWQNQRSSFSDRDDALSLNSLPNDVRINNWDSSDWRPNASSVDSKRKKKSKGNPEREREQSLSLDSPPGEEKKARTPSTYPRTSVNPATQPAQRAALENLRTRMTFSDFDDQASTDGEPNNERDLASRRRQPNFSRPGPSGGAESLPQVNLSDSREERSNRNNIREETPEKGPDSNQIVGRLMQIRDYIKQAVSMLESLQNMGDATKREDIVKVKSLIANLREQERGYLGLLQRSLHQSAGPGEGGENLGEGASNNQSAALGENDSDSVDLEVQSNASESSSSTSSRPRIEDKLGLETDEEEASKDSRHSDTLDNTLVPGRSSLSQDLDAQSTEENDAVSANGNEQEEIDALRQQQDLLRILIEKQRQLKALQDRQNFLLAKQKDAERRLAEATNRDNQARAVLEAVETVNANMGNTGPLKSNIVGYPESDDDETANARAPDNLPPDLLEIHNHLNYMRNELRHEEPERDTAPNNAEAEAASRDELRDKLQDLQKKKGRMDELLRELQILQSKRLELVNQADTESAGPSAVMPRAAEPAAAAAAVRGEEEEEEEDGPALQELMDAQEKLRKLQEVRQRLNQLRDLVQYYQSSKEGGEDEAALPDVADFAEWQGALQGISRSFESQEQRAPKLPVQESADTNNAVSALRRSQPPPESQQSNEENASETGTNADSQLSSLGPWGDDPELQEKVRKLMTAKERLRQLQELVTLVQQSPEAVHSLPEDLAQLAASLEEDVGADSSQPLPDEPNISVSEGEIPPASQGEEARASEAGELNLEQQELENLRLERRRLLAIQEQLKSLHDQFAKEENVSESDDQNDTTEKVSGGRSRQNQSAPVVTFASNDELYSKMRKQRMLREELRQKKKELEAIMRKDRNKRQYFRNQDNQSDTVSYSTDAFGASASADATMATWGGSTVDNLEHITEYDDRNAERSTQPEEEDDGYPSDGIVQVEEEEEENQSDNGTYTIEQDARQRRSARVQREVGTGAIPKVLRKSQSFPQPLADDTQPKQASRSKKRSKQAPAQSVPQEAGESTAAKEKVQEASQLESFQRQLEQTAQMCRLLLQESPGTGAKSLQPSPISPSGGFEMEGSFREGLAGSSDRYVLQQQQLQQQQLMLSMNQCYQQLSLQQMEMRNIQMQINQLAVQFSATQGDPMQVPPVTPLTSLSTIPTSTAASFNLQTSRQAVFTLNPQFSCPDPFAREGQPQSASAVHQNLFEMSQLQPLDRESGEAPCPHSASADTLRSGRQQSTEAALGPRDKGREASTAPPSCSRSSDQRRWASSQNNQASGADQWRTHGGTELPRGSGGGGASGGHRSQHLASRPHRHGRSPSRNQEASLDSYAGSELSLFETLRETIYAEVATLISQNESRPHFLIELFRELQMLKSDYTRQKFLVVLQDLQGKSAMGRISYPPQRERRLPSPSLRESPTQPLPPWLVPGAGEQVTASEVTPSESVLTSDEEMYFRGSRERRRKPRHSPAAGTVPPGAFDYMEVAENTSSLSTPSNHCWESPFNQDSLGDTVIHFDKELKKMQDYERRKEEQRQRVTQARQAPEVSSSSAMCQDSESSIPDTDYSRVDLLQLDQLIKSTVAEVLPVIREHIDDVCSPQLLSYIKRLILMLTREKNSDQDFARFFNRDMGAIVQDILGKYEGRKMRDIKDDLIIDLSEVLFNELAFFRLMQDLDDPSLTEKVRARAWMKSGGEERAAVYRQEVPEDEETDGNESSSEQSSESESAHPSKLRMTATEEDDLGKERDDELANDTTVRDADEKDDDADTPYSGAVSIQLAVSETKPFTRIGSDEDDDDDDNSQSVEDPSETAVSRDAWRESSVPASASLEAHGPEPGTEDTRASRSAPVHSATEEEEDLTPRNPLSQTQGEQQEADGTAVNLDKPSPPSGPAADPKSSQSNGPVVNGEAEEELTLDDLPAALNVASPEGLVEKVKEEEQAVSGLEGILQTMDTGNELAGDPAALPNPDAFSGPRSTEL